MAVRYEIRDRVAVLTIDRPEARNAVSPEVALGIESGLDDAEADAAIGAIILAATPPAFCAGADLGALSEGRAAELSTVRGGFAGIVQRNRTKPLIAAVDGPAVAGGAEIVLACDLVVASTRASFGLPEVKRGLVAAGGGLFRLGRKLPLNVAMECALTGQPLCAEDAHRYGLINRLCSPGEALEAALGLAGLIVENAPLAVRESRAIVADCTFASDALGWERSEKSRHLVRQSEDVLEGVAAFLEKRRPVWRGR